MICLKHRTSPFPAAVGLKLINREILLSFRKVHVLHHAANASRGPKASRSYKITNAGREVLQIVRKQLKELGDEVGKH
jgi:hypothetical protein